MKRITCCALFFVFGFNTITFCQDTLFLKTKEQILAKVLEVSDQSITYKRNDNITGPDYKMNKEKLVKISFANGLQECYKKEKLFVTRDAVSKMPENKKKEESFQVKNNQEVAYYQGVTDASRYYRKYKGAGTGTFFTSLLLNGFVGLIPAVATSASKPKLENLGFPDAALNAKW